MNTEHIIAERWRGKVEKKKPCASLSALQWAAERAGQSYGVFTQRLTAEDEAHIQEAFETFKQEREAKLALRAARVENELPSTGGFIINDNDN